MGRSVYITTPIPTLEEVGKRLKMSKARQQRLIEIIASSALGHSSTRHRSAQAPANGRQGNRNGTAKGSAPGKTSKHAAAS
ncbi:MAG: hypothetical protein ABSC48_00280 [Terracidiphilus sp.]|jgi:hypothetical protein